MLVSAAALAAVQRDDPVSSAGPAPRPAPAIPHHAERSPFRPSDRLAWPDHGAVTGAFGEMRGGHRHEGIDIPEPEGTPIRAAAPGRVVLREIQQGYGRYTCIAHRTITTCYGHQSRFRVKLGARVRRGQVIGYVGNSGDTNAYHLHFEVRRGTRPWGAPVSPRRMLPRKR
jgi:murein DD-endopeptidase MepM/ murein hydrolase activator NlpD